MSRFFVYFFHFIPILYASLVWKEVRIDEKTEKIYRSFFSLILLWLLASCDPIGGYSYSSGTNYL
jgi:hypothetical protein